MPNVTLEHVATAFILQKHGGLIQGESQSISKVQEKVLLVWRSSVLGRRGIFGKYCPPFPCPDSIVMRPRSGQNSDQLQLRKPEAWSGGLSHTSLHAAF